MKHFILFIILFGSTILFHPSDLNAQIVVLQYRSVPQNNIADFIFRETTYWSEVASKAIREGKMLKWELWQRSGGYEMHGDAHNFIFLNVYEDKYDLDEHIWDITKVFHNIRVTDMETTSLGKTIHELVLEKHKQAGLAQGKYAKFNYTKVYDMPSFMKFESEEWYPFIDKAIREGDTSFIGWGLYSVITPTGSEIPFDAITIDHFDLYSEAVIPRWTEDLVYPDTEASLTARNRVLTQIYQLVVSVPN
ncbi:MAG: hypothetical protein ACJA01_003282 [Saprospiraceae bacterium]|jgi:hypothetical protein